MSNMNLNHDQDDSNIDTHIDQSILIGIRLPNGQKKQKVFSSHEKLRTVMEYALDGHYDVRSILEYKFLIMPNLIIHDLNKTIGFYKIENRSMLFVIEKSSIC